MSYIYLEQEEYYWQRWALFTSIYSRYSFNQQILHEIN